MPFRCHSPELRDDLRRKLLDDGETVVGDNHNPDDIRQVENLYAASRELTRMVQNRQFRLDKSTSDRLHMLVAQEEALEWGHFRGEGEEGSYTPSVRLSDDREYNPPPTVPGAAGSIRMFSEGVAALALEVEDPRERAMAYFLFGALQQFYFDGNKRTARFMMNGILMSKGFCAISVPAARGQEFDQEMDAFYTGRDATRMMNFMIDCQGTA